jgi:outer membrane protein TolC
MQASEHSSQLITALQELDKARSGVLASRTPFFPTVTASVQAERYVNLNPQDHTGAVVGTTPVGGQASTFSNYPSVSTTWNLYNGGKDIAGYQSAQALERAADADVLDRAAGVLADLIQTYAALKKAELGARYSTRALVRLDGMVNRATRRLSSGFGTNIDISRAQVDRETNEQTRLTSCQDTIRHSSELAQIIGVRLIPGRVYHLLDPIPPAPEVAWSPDHLEERIELDPAVRAAKDRLVSARQKLQQARAGYRPTLALVGRRDWLGQSPDQYRAALGNTSASSYSYGLTLQQALFPFTTVAASVDSAQADVIEAEAKYRQSVIDAEARLRDALNGKIVADMTLESALRSLKAAHNETRLTEELLGRGQADQDAVDRAGLGANKGEQTVETATVDVSLKAWLAFRALSPADFAARILSHLNREGGSP